jgi:hypothetical protein
MRLVSITVISAWILALGGAGCTPLIVTHHKGMTASPGNVASLFTVERRDGKPLGELTAGAIEIYEENQLVPASVTRQTLLDPAAVVSRHALLLIDLSLCNLSAKSLQAVIAAGEGFVARLAQQTSVGIWGYDGKPELTELSKFTRDRKALGAGLAALERVGERDSTIDLHGSLVRALGVLQAEMKRSPRPVRWGTLVLITSSKDVAAKLTRQEVVSALDAAKIERYAVGVGDVIDQGLLEAVSPRGNRWVNLGTEPRPVVTEEDREKGVTPTGPPARPLLATTLEQLAATINRRADALRVLSYCSPLRAGEHYVRVKVTVGGESMDFSFKIDATGFGPGCDPRKVPTF